jgi:tRNA threonylcarbamoyladenosine biosynthesis protein TsaB
MSCRILSINCSNVRWTSLGFLEGKSVKGEMNLDLGKKQSSLLPAFVHFFLSSFSLKVSDVDFFAVVNGPGSFTGIKVGVAFSQFLAWASGTKPVIQLSSLECLAYARLSRTENLVCPLLWAGGGKIYSSLFTTAGAEEPPRELIPQKAYGREELIEALSSSKAEGREVLYITDAPEKVSKMLAESPIGTLEFSHPTGAADVLLARLHKNESISPRAVTAQYHRNPDIG